MVANVKSRQTKAGFDSLRFCIKGQKRKRKIISNGIVYESAESACNKLGISYPTMKKHIREKTLLKSGHSVAYLEEFHERNRPE